MTQAQQDAVDKSLAVLSEHFDALVLVTMATSEDGKTEDSRVSFHGGFHTAIGLASDAHHKLLSRQLTDSTEERE